MVGKKPSVALVYDKANVSHGGAERVLTALHATYPQAPLFTSVHSSHAKWTNDIAVVPSFLQRLQWLPMSYRLLVPFFPIAFESLDLRQYDIIISITSGEAKGVLTKPAQLHICYLLTPPRYLYSHVNEYLLHPLIRVWPLHQVVKVIVQYLRWWDRVAATRPDFIIPISKLTANRVAQLYERDTESVIYPPAPHLVAGQKLVLPKQYLLSVSRLVPYKRVDISISACIQLKKKLLVVGVGIEFKRLVQLAGQNAVVRLQDEELSKFLARANNSKRLIFFLGTVSDTQLTALYQNAIGMLMPGIEDFGITALEAASCGTPTILHETSGVTEVLTAPKHSILLSKLTADAMIEAIEQLYKQKIRSGDLQKVSRYHTFSYFSKAFKASITELWKRHNKR